MFQTKTQILRRLTDCENYGHDYKIIDERQELREKAGRPTINYGHMDYAEIIGHGKRVEAIVTVTTKKCRFCGDEKEIVSVDYWKTENDKFVKADELEKEKLQEAREKHKDVINRL